MINIKLLIKVMRLHSIKLKGYFESAMKTSKYKFMILQKNDRSAIFRKAF